ncbi:hypothetical protein GH714_005960 [Hevea brasiliensis]|uniref:Uncharacterized protein n=1 Tax=Hevea brasiliensis TaxID=3981 RepID=A0A6A6KY45_HEVBR|nr:hypothetical protein GH714_005960 [Hevea brasiliensis]
MAILAILALLVGICSLSFTVGSTIWGKWKKIWSDAKKVVHNFKNLSSELEALLHLGTDMERMATERGITSDQEYNYWRNTRIFEICREAGNLIRRYKLEENLSKKQLAELSKKMEDCAKRSYLVFAGHHLVAVILFGGGVRNNSQRGHFPMAILAILALLVGICSLSFTVGSSIWGKWKKICSDAKKVVHNFKNLSSELEALLHLGTAMERMATERGITSDHEYNYWKNTRIFEICHEAGNLIRRYKLEENLSKKQLAELSKKMEDCAKRVRNLRKDAENFFLDLKRTAEKESDQKQRNPEKENNKNLCSPEAPAQSVFNQWLLNKN